MDDTAAIDRRLVALTLAAGAADAIAFLALGQAFTANMTGNLVLVGVGVGQTDGGQVLRSLVAVAGFALGVLAGAALLSRRPGVGWSPLVTRMLAVEVVLLAVFTLAWQGVVGDAPPAATEALLAVSAVAMGLQTAAARRVSVPGVTTTFVTGTLTGLMSAAPAPTRDRADLARRAAVLGALVSGAVLGGLLVLTAARAAPLMPLLIVAGVILAGRRGGRGAAGG